LAVADELGCWQPLPPDDLVAVLAQVPVAWWLAGGWALDRYLGRVTREHADTDVQVRHRDHMQVRVALADWDMHAADPPGTLRPWPVDEELGPHIHDIWCRRSPNAPWQFQLMLAEDQHGMWLYRRDSRIRLPLDALAGPASTSSLRVLAPEIQLLYKSKALRPKDQQDFDAVLPVLEAQRRQWLRNALQLADPSHPWLHQL